MDPKPAPEVVETAMFEPPSFDGPEEGFEYAMSAYAVGDFETARQLAYEVIEQFPNTIWQKRSLFLLGRALIGLDMASEAEAVMLRSASEYPVLADYAFYLLAEYLYSKNRFTEAAGYYQRLVDGHPDSFWRVRASFMKAQALLMSGSNKGAIEAFGRFLRDHPQSDFHPDAWFGLAKALLADGKTEDAFKALRKMWVDYPGGPYEREADKMLSEMASHDLEIPKPTVDERYERARNLFKAKLYDRAYEEFSGLIKDDPNHPQRPDILFRLGLSLFHLGRRSEAVVVLEGLISEQPPARQGAEALNWLGRAYSRLGRREDAVSAYLKIVSAYPDSDLADDALYLTGNVYRGANDLKKAIAFYERLATEYPHSRYADSAIWWKAWAYYITGDYKKAASVLNDLISRYPESFLINQALYWLGRTYERMNRPDRAASYYRSVLKRGPYSYYGYRASERLAGMAPSAVSASLRQDNEAVAAGVGPVQENMDAPEHGGPPIWTEAARDVLAKEPALRKILELMHHAMKKEAAAELWSIQERVPKRQGVLLGLSKIFFELGDYYRSLIIVLKNYERYLDASSGEISRDFWLLSYPLGYWQLILEASKKYGQDPYFVAAIIHQESMFQPEALSPAGARGVMQVMPTTGEWAAQMMRLGNFDHSRLYDPETNIAIGTWYIGYLMKRFKGDILLVAAAYNAGPEAVSSWLSMNGNSLERDEFVESIPFSETRRYVKKVLRNYAEYRRIYGKTPPPSMLTPLPILDGLENER